jgi:hypothetical protein
LVAVLLGHALGGRLLTYPFVRWDMYSRPRLMPTLSKHIMVFADGTESHYPYKIASFSSPRTVQARLDQMVTLCRCQEGNAVVDWAIEQLVAHVGRHSKARPVRFEIRQVWVKRGTGERLRYRWRD